MVDVDWNDTCRLEQYTQTETKEADWNDTQIETKQELLTSTGRVKICKPQS